VITIANLSAKRPADNPALHRFILRLLGAFGLLAGALPLAATAAPPDEAPGALLLPFPEAKAMRPPIMEPIPDAERAIRTVGRWHAEELTAVSPGEWEAWQALPENGEKIRAHLEALLEETRVITMRDEAQVIQALVLDGERMDTCALLFHRGLVRRFEDILGPEFFVAVPSRFRLYLFPKLATEVQTFAPMVLSDFRATAYPVSPEVFEVSLEGIRAVGLLDDR
jgi:hypothetical protein